MNVKREARCEGRFERARTRAGAGIGVEAKPSFDGAGVAACGGRRYGAAAETARAMEDHARAALLHEGDSLVIKAIGTRRSRRGRTRALDEGYSAGMLGDRRARVLLDEYRARDGTERAREADR